MPEITNPYSTSSDEVQEIVGSVPHWIIRRGITALFIVFAITIVVSNLISYPDVISGRAIIHATEQPFKLTWYITDPNITYTPQVKDAQMVKIGDTLVLENNLEKGVTTPYTTNLAGKAYLLRGLEDNPLATMLLVVPPVSKFEVQLKLPTWGAGKLEKGQRVIIRLDAFPSKEFGFLQGEVTNVVPVLVDNQYRANVVLTSRLVTNTGYELAVQPLMQGEAEVFMQDKSLFQRVFSSLL